MGLYEDSGLQAVRSGVCAMCNEQDLMTDMSCERSVFILAALTFLSADRDVLRSFACRHCELARSSRLCADCMLLALPHHVREEEQARGSRHVHVPPVHEVENAVGTGSAYDRNGLRNEQRPIKKLMKRVKRRIRDGASRAEVVAYVRSTREGQVREHAAGAGWVEGLVDSTFNVTSWARGRHRPQ